jgi:hypothetical protein
MGAQFTSATTSAIFDTDQVTITRRGERIPGSNPPAYDPITVWSGLADFQSGTGDTYYSPAGVVQQADATVIINPAADGSLPAPQTGDAVTVSPTLGGQTFTQKYEIVQVNPWTAQPIHLELYLKQGGQGYQGPK